MIEFRTLGTLDLRRTDGYELHTLLAQPKRIALLAYLCLAGPRGFHRRDTLLGLFWPDSDEAHARTSLRTTLHLLRRALGDDALLSRGDEEIAVNFNALWCDGVAFDELIAAGKAIEALSLYRGDLLPGFFIDDVPQFERWLAGERSRLRSSASHAARLAAETQEAERNVTEAVSWARRAVELTEGDERAVRRLVELLMRAGDQAGALQAYDDFASRLAAEFEVQPSEETRALAERLRRGVSFGAPARESLPGPPTPGVAHGGETGTGYEIGREIGKGGTGTVFLARDLKHKRSVALKVLRPEVAVTLGTRRFLAEISIAAGLHHPNIVTLLDSGEIDGRPFYTMPYVEGETLRARMRREGPLQIEDALRIARDVADALSYAHAHGVVHRDVKPENILLESGRALVTDFGIARAITEASSDHLTETGLALGTAAYMSPEQSDGGREIDVRTDVYSLGCVVYEMLTGDPPFAGSTKQAVLTRKLTEHAPPLRNVRESISPALEATVLRSLARTPADRFRTVQEFSDSLLASRSGRGNPARWPIPRSRKSIAAAVGGVALLAATVGAFRVVTAPVAPPTERTKLTFTGKATQGALSHDGQFLAYVMQLGDSQRLIVQDLTGGPSDTVMTYTRTPVDNRIEWSPDGSRLLVRIDRKAVVVHRRGGRQEVVPKFQQSDQAAWLPDGLRVSLSNLRKGRLAIVTLKTGDEALIRVPRAPSWSFDGAWSPDGRFLAIMADAPEAGRWTIRTIGLDGRTEDVVEDSVSINSPRWSSDGDALYYIRDTDAIWRVGISTRTGKATGAPEQVQSGMEALPGIGGLIHFSLSGDSRRLVYAKGDRFSNIYRIDVTSDPERPRVERLTDGTALRWTPAVSPDGNWIAFAARTSDGSELFRMPITGGRPVPITSGAAVSRGSQIAWSPEGDRIAFQSLRTGKSNVFVVTVATGEMRQFAKTVTSRRTAHLTWEPGSRITYQVPRTHIRGLDPITGEDVLLARDTADASFHFPIYSPGGKELAMVRYHEPEGNLVTVVRMSDGAEKRLPPGLFFLRGWDPSGRYVFAQVTSTTKMFRVDTRGGKPPELLFRAPAVQMECDPAGARHSQTFICAMSDFVSDIWMIENFDRRSR